MPTDYDAISGQYQRAKRQPWRGHIEAFTFFGMLGDLTGKQWSIWRAAKGTTPGCSRASGRQRSWGWIGRRG